MFYALFIWKEARTKEISKGFWTEAISSEFIMHYFWKVLKIKGMSTTLQFFNSYPWGYGRMDDDVL